ncbi:hypothetical protein ACEQPO_08600 [Bacillus sp. SL00103]
MTKAEKQLSQASQEKQEAEKAFLCINERSMIKWREYEQARQKKMRARPDLLKRKNS